MSETTLIEVFAMASRLSPAAMFVAVLYGGYKQWWVWGWQLREMRADRDFWRGQATRVTQVAERNVAPGTTP